MLCLKCPKSMLNHSSELVSTATGRAAAATEMTMAERMDGLDGRRDGRMDRCMDGWMYGLMEA